MRSRSGRAARLAACGLAAALSASGCATSSAPGGFLPKAEKAEREPYGAWVDVRYILAEDHLVRMRGELIAIDADTLHVLTKSGWGAVAIDDVWEAKITTFEQDLASIGLLGFFGTISAGSHGFYALISIPAWAVISIASNTWASTHSRILLHGGRDERARRGIEPPRVSAWRRDWVSARKFGRFPQGLPSGIDRAALKPKPMRPPRHGHPPARGLPQQ